MTGLTTANRTTLRNTIMHLVLICGALVMAAPFIRMVVMSLMTLPEVQAFPPVWWPNDIQWNNYAEALGEHGFGTAIINSLIVTVLSVSGATIVAAMAGYAFARIRFRGRDAIFILFLATLMIPHHVTIIPLYTLAFYSGILDSYVALILPNLFNPFSIFLLRQYFMSMPDELEEAALVDGASRLKIFLLIMLPLSKPALAAAALLTFLSVWNDLLWPLVVISSSEMYTVPLALASYEGYFETDLAVQMASASMAVVPIIILFIFLQRHFIAGIASTGLK